MYRPDRVKDAQRGSPAFERALAETDPAIEQLDEPVRQQLGLVWAHRATREATAALGFTRLCQDLLEGPATPATRWQAARAVADELRHESLCRRVAERYLGQELPALEPEPFVPASFGSCPESLNRTLRVVLSCCFSEAIGSAHLKACLDAAAGRTARVALRELLKDEIVHARLGYAHLASGAVPAAQLAQVRRAVPTLLSMIRGSWLAPTAGIPREVVGGHGWLDIAQTSAVVESTISSLVLPGLLAAGVPAQG